MRQIVDILITPLVAALVWLIAHTPRPIGAAVSRIVVKLALSLSPKFRRTAIRNLELTFPSLSTEEREGIYRRSRDILAQNLYYFAIAPQLTLEDFEKLFDYSELRKRLAEWRKKANGKGLFYFCLHYGCFELMAHAHGRLDQPMTILARDFGLPRLDRWWKARREKFGNKLFSRAGGFKEMLSNLNRGEDVSVLVDQNVKRNHAVFVSHFGIPTATSKAIGIAALRSGSPVIVCAAIAIGEGKFEMMAEEVPNPGQYPGSSDEQILQFLEAVHRVIERYVQRAPENWFWIHRRFKTRPQGEPESLYDNA